MLQNNLNKAPLVKINSFSGPLDLLLQLIHKQEMDIFEIDIYQITSQYLEYLKSKPYADLENAGDFIYIASLLLYIKSKSLISSKENKEEENLDEASAIEMKEKLSKMLFIYHKFQKAGQLLYNRPLIGKDCWKSPRTLIFKKQGESQIDIDQDKGQFELIQAYHTKLKNEKIKERYKIKKPIPTVIHHLKQITKYFSLASKFKFSELLLFKKEPYNRLLSFLSLLELSKKGFVSLFQKNLFSNIEIVVKKTLTEEAIKTLSPNAEIKTERNSNYESI